MPLLLTSQVDSQRYRAVQSQQAIYSNASLQMEKNQADGAKGSILVIDDAPEVIRLLSEFWSVLAIKFTASLSLIKLSWRR
ncbi:MAG: hypothetical protein HC839_07270 [Leptolyngbyaceae cyanobacterium RM2_2_21]|nr:hypothetical protein [Leptolyngbyaceae cyanobacterium RM2_2_21]